MKLYEINLRGLSKSYFVVANHPTEAENLISKFLKKQDLGLEKDREIKTITLLAEDKDYPNCGHCLLITEEKD